MAINYFVKVIFDGIKSFKDKTFVANGIPFVNKHNAIDEQGGIWVAPGKGSHSFNTHNGVAKMRPAAGTRNGAVLTLCLFITPTNACAGEFLLGKELYLTF